MHFKRIVKELKYEKLLFTVDNNNNNNNNNDNNNNHDNSNNNNYNNSSNNVIIKSTKNAKSKYFWLLSDLSRKRIGLLKRKKKSFVFLN